LKAKESGAENQLQAVLMTSFFFVPSIMLSGILFPFDLRECRIGRRS
jgi:hypothetical protein